MRTRWNAHEPFQHIQDIGPTYCLAYMLLQPSYRLPAIHAAVIHLVILEPCLPAPHCKLVKLAEKHLTSLCRACTSAVVLQ